VLHIQKLAGFIYILSNELMPGIVKIGFTERTVAERVAELSAPTGVALPYKEEASFPVTEPSKVEKAIHESLERYRVNQGREFFRMTPGEAIVAVRRILGLPLPRAKPLQPTPASYSVHLGGFGSSRYEKLS